MSGDHDHPGSSIASAGLLLVVQAPCRLFVHEHPVPVERAQHTFGDVQGSEVSLGRFFQDQLVQCEIGNRSLEPCVLQFQLLQFPGMVDRKTAVFVSPPVIGLLGTSICFTARATVSPLARATSTSRSFRKICSGLCLFLGISTPFKNQSF